MEPFLAGDEISGGHLNGRQTSCDPVDHCPLPPAIVAEVRGREPDSGHDDVPAGRGVPPEKAAAQQLQRLAAGIVDHGDATGGDSEGNVVERSGSVDVSRPQTGYHEHRFLTDIHDLLPSQEKTFPGNIASSESPFRTARIPPQQTAS